MSFTEPPDMPADTEFTIYPLPCTLLKTMGQQFKVIFLTGPQGSQDANSSNRNQILLASCRLCVDHDLEE
jgi:hypothetical protein